MKKKLIALVMTVAMLSGAYAVADQRVEKSTIQADYFVYKDVDELAAGSDLVVKAVVTENSKNVVKEHDGFLSGYTLTDVKVLTALKGTHDQKKPLTIIEPTYTVEKGIAPGKIQFSYEDYTKMASKGAYILFLKWDEEIQGYWVSGLHQGKHNIDGQDAIELATRGNNKNLQLLSQEVLAKYEK